MSGNQQFKSNLKVKKRFCKRFVQLKQAERRSQFLKNEPSFTFFQKSAEQSAAAIAPCLPRCPERVVH
ncbi:MAG: hypothetical protein II184_03200, partial [Clostridia bacterium]|nr:hypothetical protein [Clostridia bacterium]